jgi:hypothetical protein
VLDLEEKFAEKNFPRPAAWKRSTSPGATIAISGETQRLLVHPVCRGTG